MFANSKRQDLSNHSLAVANIALKLFDKLDLQERSSISNGIDNVSKFKENIFLSGILHDWGKIDKNFQDFIQNKLTTDNEEIIVDGVHYQNDKSKEGDPFSFDLYPRHNEVSWAFSQLLTSIKDNKVVPYVVYYHHAKIERRNKKGEIENWGSVTILDRLKSSLSLDKFKKDSEIFFNKILVNTKDNYKDLIVSLIKNLENITEDSWNSTNEVLSPSFLYKLFKDTDKYDEKLDILEVYKMITRSLIISADRIVSSWSSHELNERIEANDWQIIEDTQDNHLVSAVSDMIDKFNINNQNNPSNRDRDRLQNITATNLAQKSETSILFGPAGCGKTKIFLEWYYQKNKNLENPKRLYIIAPRKMICESLYNELHKDYIPQASIELITGDKKVLWNGSQEIDISLLEKKDQFKANVVVTTIDQILSLLLSHKNIDMLLDIINSHVVFDEYHEFFNMPGIVLLFKNIITMKSMKENANTLLVSATPNYYFIEDVLNLKKSNVEYIDTFNKELFNFKFNIFGRDKKIEDSDLFRNQPSGSIVIFNTAKNSQLSTIKVRDENSVNFHSRFTPNDKAIIYKDIIKEWSSKIPYSSKVLRSGPIVQASLNISTMNLVTQICSAENWCQRVGRSNRFANNLSQANVETIFNLETLLNNYTNNAELKFLKTINSGNQSVSWIQYLLRNDIGGLTGEDFKGLIIKQMTLSDLYKEYRDYHDLLNTKESYKKDFEDVLIESLKVFNNNDFTPIQRFYKVSKKKNSKLSSVSLRGKSVYVLPVVYEMFSKVKQGWLYMPSTTLNNKEAIALGENDLKKYQHIINSQKSILTTRKIDGFTDVTYSSQKNYAKIKDFKIIKEAKESSAPIILSYMGNSSDEQRANSQGLVYLLKGNLKIGLVEFQI